MLNNLSTEGLVKGKPKYCESPVIGSVTDDLKECALLSK